MCSIYGLCVAIVQENLCVVIAYGDRQNKVSDKKHINMRLKTFISCSLIFFIFFN